MLGIYPPGENNYKIEESQKYNAVPPIEGFDFKPWIDEMGLEALPHQTTIFPIQMNGWSYDYMLALDDDNCPVRAQKRAEISATIEKDVKDKITASLPAMQSYVDQYGLDTFCSYVNWAYTESIELKEEVESKTPLETMFATCQATMKIQTTAWAQQEAASLGNVSSNDVRGKIRDYVNFWLTKMPSTPDATKQQLTQDLKKANLKTTAGAGDPNYVLFWTNEALLNLFAQSISADATVQSMLPLPPSSTILLEFTEDGSGALNVEGFINDQAVTLTQCGEATSCGASAFSAGLNSTMGQTNVTNWCIDKTQKTGTQKLNI